MDDLTGLSALDIARLVRTKQVSPREVVDAHLARIDRYDGGLHTFETLTPDAARADADAKTAALAAPGADPRALPPLFGVPVTIKDLNALAGVPLHFGSRAYAAFVAPWTDLAVQRLLDAGCISLGKTATPEFGTVPVTEPLLSGPTRNPWNAAYTPGGSSGGAAAGVAAGFAPFAQGSDGGGSIRIPSSCCGTFGLKSSRGRVTSAPLGAYLTTYLAGNGPIARSVADAAALLDAMAQGPVPGDAFGIHPPATPFVDAARQDPGRLRVGWSLHSAGGIVERVCADAVNAACGLLSSAGHDVADEAQLPDVAALAPDFAVLWKCIAGATPCTDPSLLEPLTAWMVEEAGRISAVDLANALYRLNTWARGYVGACENYDVVVTPVVTGPPLAIGSAAGLAPPEQFDMYIGWAGVTGVANVTGQPAVSLPLAATPDGLPIGVQIVGRPEAEATLLALSRQIEEIAPWGDRHPPLQ